MRKKTFTPKQKIIRVIPYSLLSYLLEENKLNVFLKNVCNLNDTISINEIYYGEIPCALETASSFLNYAFNWSLTEEGYHYWNGIYVNLRCIGD